MKAKRKKFKPRNVNIHPTVLGGKGERAGIRIHMGDSLQTVPCPNSILKGMRQNLRRATRRSQVMSPYRQKGARDIMIENKIPMRRTSTRKR